MVETHRSVQQAVLNSLRNLESEEAARMIEAFNKAAKESNSDTSGFIPLTLLSLIANVAKDKAEKRPVADGIQTAITASHGTTEYYRGFRNALKYALWLLDAAFPEYEGPTLGNDTTTRENAAADPLNKACSGGEPCCCGGEIKKCADAIRETIETSTGPDMWNFRNGLRYALNLLDGTPFAVEIKTEHL